MDKSPSESLPHDEAKKEFPPVAPNSESYVPAAHERTLLEASDKFTAQQQIHELKDELGLPSGEEPLSFRQFEQYLPDHLQVKEGEENIAKRHLRHLFLEQLVKTQDSREIPAFTPGDPLGEWLVATMRTMGYQVSMQENERLGLIVVNAIEKMQAPQENAPIREQKETLTPESVAESLLESTVMLERELSSITLTDEGKLVFPELLRGHEIGQLSRIEEIRKQQGVLDAQLIMGCIVVVYNSREYTPAGFPDLGQENRCGEYNPNEQIVYIDIQDSYSFVEERYKPSSPTMRVVQMARHEVDHYLVNYSDHKIGHRLGKEAVNRYSEDEETKNEQFLQLAYLDELHSHFFDVIGGRQVQAFQNQESKFYSVAREGKHPDVAGNEEKTKADTKELFAHLQLLILFNEFAGTLENEENKQTISRIIEKSGTALGLARNVAQAFSMVKAQVANLKDSQELTTEFKQFLETYQPDVERFTPVVSPEVKAFIV